MATGRGAVLFPAAAAVGESGKVTGIDLADAMAQKTNEDAKSCGISARVMVMDAENPEFDDASFDYVLCGFGIMFFPDQLRALEQFRRILKPGGKLGLTTWRFGQNSEFDPVMTELGMKIPPHAPGWITEARELAELLTRASFKNVRVEEDEAEFPISGVEEYWQQARGTGFRRVLDALDAGAAKSLREGLARRLETLRGADGIKVKMTALIALAER